MPCRASNPIACIEKRIYLIFIYTVGVEKNDPINSAWPLGRANNLDFKSGAKDFSVGAVAPSNILSALFIISESLVESVAFALRITLTEEKK